ncbi:MAG: hypothetical protein AABY32_02540 [Nanoarchaeota archaeon]
MVKNNKLKVTIRYIMDGEIKESKDLFFKVIMNGQGKEFIEYKGIKWLLKKEKGVDVIDIYDAIPI